MLDGLASFLAKLARRVSAVLFSLAHKLSYASYTIEKRTSERRKANAN